MARLRSLIYLAVLIITVIPYAILCMLWAPLPFHMRYQLTAFWPRSMVWFAKIICGVSYKVHGAENFPDGPCVLLPKHQSIWETFYFAGHSPRDLCFVYKRELHWVPFFGWGLGLLRMIHIDRARAGHAFESVVEQGTRRIAEGRWIIMFPEGTRIPVGRAGQYKTGGTRLATRLHVPVVPIAHNAGEFWPRKKFVLHPGCIQVSIGPCMSSENISPEDLMKKVESWIEGEMRRLSPHAYGDEKR